VLGPVFEVDPRPLPARFDCAGLVGGGLFVCVRRCSAVTSKLGHSALASPFSPYALISIIPRPLLTFFGCVCLAPVRALIAFFP